MNQLEAEQLIEEAKKYIGKTVNIYRFDGINAFPKKILCRYDGENVIIQNKINDGKTTVQVTAKLHIEGLESDWLPDGIQFMIEKFKEQQKK